MRNRIKFKCLVMIALIAMVSLLTGCSGSNKEWKVISLDKANEGKETLKVVNEENTNSIPDDLIYEESAPIDEIKTKYVPYQYVINDVGNGKESIKNIQTEKEVIVNKDKFGDNETVKSILAGGEYGYVLDNYIIVFISNPNHKEGDKNTALYNEIKWYDLKNEKWSSVDVSKYPYLSSIILNLNNNELFLLGYDIKGDNPSDVTEKIYYLNLDKAKIKEESKLDVKGTAYLDYEYLSENKMIFTNIPNPNTIIRILDFKNKIFSELIDQELALSNTSMYMIDKTLAPSKDRFFYETEKDGVISIYVLVIGEDDKIKADGKVYEYNKDKDVHINWSKDSKKLIIGENIELNGTPQNYKVLEFNI